MVALRSRSASADGRPFICAGRRGERLYGSLGWDRSVRDAKENPLWWSLRLRVCVHGSLDFNGQSPLAQPNECGFGC